MSYLLDTHALLFWLFDDPRLSTAARRIMADSEHEIYVSAASAWEIATKHRLGKFEAARPLIGDISKWIVRARMKELPITAAHATKAGSWPQPHRDPFDRMLAAQSAMESLPLISRDRALHQFGVALVW
jgi:PIN domain nuclease of toxin-antitoxin system